MTAVLKELKQEKASLIKLGLANLSEFFWNS